MSDLTVSFRDFAVAIIPSIIFFLACSLWIPVVLPGSSYEFLKDLGLTIASVIFLLSYALGVIFHQASNLTVRKRARKAFRVEDKATDFWRSQKGQRLKAAIRTHYRIPSDLEPKSFTYFVLRKIEMDHPDLAKRMNRWVSLDNLSYAMVPPLLIFCASSFFRILHILRWEEGKSSIAFALLVISLLALFLARTATISGEKYRELVVRNVLNYILLVRSKAGERADAAGDL